MESRVFAICDVCAEHQLGLFRVVMGMHQMHVDAHQQMKAYQVLKTDLPIMHELFSLLPTWPHVSRTHSFSSLTAVLHNLSLRSLCIA
jgi:hypothetical protein